MAIVERESELKKLIIIDSRYHIPVPCSTVTLHEISNYVSLISSSIMSRSCPASACAEECASGVLKLLPQNYGYVILVAAGGHVVNLYLIKQVIHARKKFEVKVCEE